MNRHNIKEMAPLPATSALEEALSLLNQSPTHNQRKRRRVDSANKRFESTTPLLEQSLHALDSIDLDRDIDFPAIEWKFLEEESAPAREPISRPKGEKNGRHVALKDNTAGCSIKGDRKRSRKSVQDTDRLVRCGSFLDCLSGFSTISYRDLCGTSSYHGKSVESIAGLSLLNS